MFVPDSIPYFPLRRFPFLRRSGGSESAMTPLQEVPPLELLKLTASILHLFIVCKTNQAHHRFFLHITANEFCHSFKIIWQHSPFAAIILMFSTQHPELPNSIHPCHKAVQNTLRFSFASSLPQNLQYELALSHAIRYFVLTAPACPKSRANKISYPKSCAAAFSYSVFTLFFTPAFYPSSASTVHVNGRFLLTL